jgi:hypothetical protein
VGAPDEQAAAKYRKRDELIMLGLRSSDVAEQEKAMDQLEKSLRWPLATVLQGIALRSTSEAFEFILDQNLRVDKKNYKLVWQETMQCVCENIKKKKFVFKGNLLGYLSRISWRVTYRMWRKERRHLQNDALETITAKASADLEESEDLDKLLKTINQFHSTLNENDQMALQIGMRHMTGDDSRPESMKVLAQKIRLSKIWDGSVQTILRRYDRLREKLRKFLNDRGYNV